MDSLQNLLQSKAGDLNDAKKNDTSLAQQEIDRFFPGQVKVNNITPEGVIYLRTSSSPIASELRMQQVQIIYVLNSCLKAKIAEIRIVIR